MTPEEEEGAKLRAKARGKLVYAIKKGILVRPSVCGDCGESSPRIIAHHEDYNKPLDVAWICQSCHNKRHSHRTDLWDKDAMKFIETANFENMNYKASTKLKAWLEEYADNKNVSPSMLLNYITYRFMKLKNTEYKY